MIVVVNDASLLIDLLKIDLSDEFFRLSFDMHTTDLVSAEITDENAEKFQQYIKNKMIKIRNFSNEEWEKILEIKADNLALSFADCSCLWLCGQLSATLLTSDGKLRSTAIDRDLPVHGILWSFDQLISHGMITIREAKTKLTELMEINPRLPRDECHRRIKKWKSNPFKGIRKEK